MSDLLAFITWNASPEIISLGPITLRWYGLLFAAGFLAGLYIVKAMFKEEGAPEEWLDKIFIYMVVGAVLGARLGHVFFYDWDYYSQHLAEIPMVWKGGLASHGGAIGIILALYIFSVRESKRSVLWILDKVVVPTALAGCFIRLGNLMNSEIVGKATDAPWGFKFPRHETGLWERCQACAERTGQQCMEVAQMASGDFCVELAQVPARHPVQLYESMSYLLTFFLLYWVYWKTDMKERQGRVFGLFLVLVLGVIRFGLEYFKTSQGGFESVVNGELSTGQLLSLPFLAIGLFFLFRPAGKAKA
ncbi:prolipoprotein diacylglyceryl transferase [Phaeodactylibacter luteus]|uniref:Phosphatidylglycerol--prolipoprotein diacylglyceryl transferase n=1 Tax=Phaeodactylibacter luteus TaxID=1564516 RepID=A0A5C6RNJ2_9BACT|nr:prolipoprotein diacylglyceryl transferase [Phaeodactylibacter luteus]TXB63200.1 prolipoprotein diacylglyceryl transferase [Phaeodactylibacter luteus]